MKIGDKVKVTYTNGDQFLGVITAETTKTWTIDFDGEDSRRIKKSMDIVLVDNPKTPKKEVVTMPSTVVDYAKKQARGMNWRVAIWVGIAFALATVAILVGLDIITLGAGGFMGK
jgi:hypothetical protein